MLCIACFAFLASLVLTDAQSATRTLNLLLSPDHSQAAKVVHRSIRDSLCHWSQLVPSLAFTASLASLTTGGLSRHSAAIAIDQTLRTIRPPRPA